MKLHPLLFTLFLVLAGCSNAGNESTTSFNNDSSNSQDISDSKIDSESSSETSTSSSETSTSSSESESISESSSSSEQEEIISVDYSNILINELCSKTRYCYLDKFEEESDWIELYNSGSEDINLLGCGLSNKVDKQYAFTFDDFVLKAHDYLVLAATDRGVSKYKGEYHLPFTLSQPKGGNVIFSSPNEIVSQVSYPILKDDISYGLIEGEYTTLQPSPGNDNETVYIEKQTLEKPKFSVASGMYDDEFDLEISGPKDSIIYYTLDCSLPSVASSVFENSIRVKDPSNNPNVIASRTDICGSETPYVPTDPVNKCFVVRAVAYDSNGNHSPVVSASYWINQSGFLEDNIPLTSICTDNDNLFDNEKGIYCRGKIYDDWINSSEYDSGIPFPMQPANYRQKGFEWEREANLTLVEGNKVKCEQEIGLRIKGNYTRGYAKKSFNLYSRILYDGNNKFTYKFNGMKCKKIALRSGGNLVNYPIADVINSGLAKKYNLNVETQENKATYLYLNGEFWGLYFYSDVFDDEYFSNKYDADDPIVYKDTDIEEGFKTDIAFFNNIRHMLNDSTLSDEDYLSAISQNINISSMIDSLLIHLIIGVNDFIIVSYNSGCWLNRNELQGFNKAKYLLYDTDWLDYDMDQLFEQYRQSLEVFFANPYIQGKMYVRAVELRNLLTSSEVEDYINDYYSSLEAVINQNNMRFYGFEDAGQSAVLAQHIGCYQNRPSLLVDKLLSLMEA